MAKKRDLVDILWDLWDKNYGKIIILAAVILGRLISQRNTDDRVGLLFILVIFIASIALFIKFVYFFSAIFERNSDEPVIEPPTWYGKSKFLLLNIMFYGSVLIYCGFAADTILDKKPTEISYPYDEKIVIQINNELKRLEWPERKKEISWWPEDIDKKKILIVNFDKKELERYQHIPPSRRPTTITEAIYVVAIKSHLEQIAEKVTYSESIKGRTELGRRPIFGVIWEIDIYDQKEGKLLYRNILQKPDMNELIDSEYYYNVILPALGVKVYAAPWSGLSIEKRF